MKTRNFIKIATVSMLVIIIAVVINNTTHNSAKADEKGFVMSFVEEIKSINQFSTYMYHRSFYLDSKDLTGISPEDTARKRIIRKYDGLVTAGYNFEKIDTNNFNVYYDANNQKCLKIRLPKEEILRCELNPKDRNDIVSLGFGDEQGEANQVREMLDRKAKEELIQGAIREGILTSARKNGKNEIEIILKSMGFHRIEFLK